MGIHELSMSAVSIPEVKSVLRATTMSDLERLVAKVLTLATAAEVRQEVTDYLDELGIQRGGSR